ncbi:MAG: hypothetical protein AAF617_10125 [Bacteroidota bacterium]
MGCAPDVNPYDLKFFHLRGKVKSLTKENYEVFRENGEWKSGKAAAIDFNEKLWFDTNGNLKQMERYNEAYELEEKLNTKIEADKVIEEIHYNPEGSLIGRSVITEHTDEKIAYKQINSKGKLLAEGAFFFSESDVVAWEEIHKYDPGFETPRTFKLYYEYDADNNIIKQTLKASNGIVLRMDKFEYIAFDEYNNWTKMLLYQAENEMPTTIILRTIEYY